jgi:monofunctional biosynthetic peptidoglycan transglycosylase
MARRRRKSRRLSGALRWTVRIVLLLIVADLLYLATIWPDWKQLAVGPVPKSSFIAVYEQRLDDKDWPRLRWSPVPLAQLPGHLQRAALLAEDIRFYQHSGFDLIALKEALDKNLERRELAIGGSTISQQTAKNLFLSPARNPVRKWHELILTVGMEQNLSKRRILEIYLNTAEFGRGIYGVEAAARHYWGIPASQLNVVQSAELVAALPSPVKHNPLSRTPAYERRVTKIVNLLARQYPIPGDTGVSRGGTAPGGPPEAGAPVPPDAPAPIDDHPAPGLRTI